MDAYTGFRANTLEPCDRATERPRDINLHGSIAILLRILMQAIYKPFLYLAVVAIFGHMRGFRLRYLCDETFLRPRCCILEYLLIEILQIQEFWQREILIASFHCNSAFR